MENTSITPNVPVESVEMFEAIKLAEPAKNMMVCSDVNGILPECAPLANPYVPYQQVGSEQYQPSKGVVRGTLFPGLDLPFRQMVNEGELWGTPAAELTALGFAIKELQLYMDTHQYDSEALELLNSYIAMYKAGSEKYTQLYGPLTLMDIDPAQGYMWIKNPWPWELAASVED